MDHRTVVLAGVDTSPSAARVVETAVGFASRDRGELHLVHVLPLPEPKRLTAQLEEARMLVERVAAKAHATYTTHIAAGVVAQQILQIASNIEADLIVVGAGEHSFVDRALNGSAAEGVVRRAQCPVFVVRDKNYASHRPDIEPPCEACLDVQRKSNGAELWCARHKARHVHGRLHAFFSHS